MIMVQHLVFRATSVWLVLTIATIAQGEEGMGHATVHEQKPNKNRMGGGTKSIFL